MKALFEKENYFFPSLFLPGAHPKNRLLSTLRDPITQTPVSVCSQCQHANCPYVCHRHLHCKFLRALELMLTLKHDVPTLRTELQREKGGKYLKRKLIFWTVHVNGNKPSWSCCWKRDLGHFAFILDLLFLASFPFHTGRWVKSLQSLSTTFPFHLLTDRHDVLNV